MKKIILFLMIITSYFLLLPKIVKAEQSHFYIGERVGNLWLHKKNPQDGKLYYNSVRIIREQNTNTIAYCIEPFDLVNNETSYEEIERPNNISQENLNKIKLVSYFGYGYQNHTDKEWYAVTQLMIWKLANPDLYAYLSIGLNGPPTNLFDEKISEIENLINEYNSNLSINNKSYTIVLGQELTLTDNKLNDFKVISGNNITYSNNGNTISFKGTKEGTNDIIFEKKERTYNTPAKFFYSLYDQDVIRIGDPISIINKITIKTIKTKIEIEKIDKETISAQGEAKLENCIFDILDENNNVVKNITLLNSTKGEINNLPLGNYKIKERKSGIGYKINNKVYNIKLTIDNNKTYVKFENEVIKGKIKIYKTFGTDDTFKPEPNISFNIYDSKDKLITTVKTDKDGYAEAVLPYGKYKLTQLTTTEGYKKIKTVDFTIKDESNIVLNLKNELIKGKIKIYKTFGTDDTFKPEPNINFNIYDSKDKLITTVKTDKDGYAETVLPYGKYKLTQLTTTEGYKKIKPIDFTIKDESNIVLNLKNELIKGKVKIYKTFGTDDTFKPEPNISFNIYDSKDKLITTVKTDKDGYAEAVLPYGKYKLTQLTTTEGYKKIKPIDFTIKDESNIVLNLKNELIKGKVKIYKTFGTDDTFKPEPNISFNIYDSKDKLITTVKTDKDGYAEAVLPYGKYKLTQLTTTEGYKKIKTVAFTIKDESNIVLNLKNELIKSKIKIYKTFGTDDTFKPEPNISFNIYDSKDKLITTVKTDKDGYAEAVLPYGKYKLTQLTTTEGYKKIKPIDFTIKDESNIVLNLKNYQIIVPNTKTSLLQFILLYSCKVYVYILKFLF